MDLFIDVIKYCLEWYILGFILLIFTLWYRINVSKTLDEIKVGDIQELFFMSPIGPVLILVIICIVISDAFSKVKTYLHNYKNIVLWRSKRGKSKAVLFGNKSGNN